MNGNKWFKLKHNIEHILRQGSPSVLSFGGAYSNHLQALAAAGKLFGFATIGMVRGELLKPLNPALQFASEQGMELYPLSRAHYRQQAEPDFLAHLRARFGAALILPEGGSNALAVRGCKDIASCLAELQPAATHVLMACGTGASLSGLILGLGEQGMAASRVLGVAVLRAPGYLSRQVNACLRQWPGSQRPHWHILEDFHAGGYARSSRPLREFMQFFESRFPLPIEPVYTGKLLWGLWQSIGSAVIPAGSRVVAVHTGGLPRQPGAMPD